MKIHLLVTIFWLCLVGFSLSADEREKIIQNNIIEANTFIEDNKIRAYKFDKMQESPFAFYRATAHLYYRDMYSQYLVIPQEWLQQKKICTWVQGDCHLQNFGIFDTNQNMEWNINDFDESYIGPFYFDLIRFIASMHLFSQELEWQIKPDKLDALTVLFVAEYQKTLESVVDNTTEVNFVLDQKNTTGTLLKRFKKQSTKKQSELLDKWTLTTNNKRIFDFSNSKLEKLSAKSSHEFDNIWAEYIKNKSFARNQELAIKDKAVRLFSGLGSLGVQKYYVIVEGKTSSLDDDMLIEIKEQKQPIILSSLPATEKMLYKNRFSSHAQRALTARETMLTSVDTFEGLASISESSKSFLIQKISPCEFSFEVKNIDDYAEFENVVVFCAKALAYAHSRSDNDKSKWIDYSFEKEILQKIQEWSGVKKTICLLGKQYAQQAVADYYIFTELVATGKIK